MYVCVYIYVYKNTYIIWILCYINISIIYMNNFEAKADRSEINNTVYLVPNRMSPPDRYGQALGLEPSGKCLTVKIQERISFLREEMNFQIKSCHSRLEHFWNSSWHFFTCLSIHLFICPVFHECLVWTLALWVTVMMRWDCQLSWGRECFLTSCWILVPSTIHGKLKIRLVGWSDLYTRKRMDLTPSLQEVAVVLEDVVIRN